MTEKKLKLRSALIVADRFMKYIDDSCYRVEVAGSCRRRVEAVGDIEIVCVPKGDLVFSKIFPEGYSGMVVNGPRLKRFKYPELNVQIELYITTQEDWGRMLAIRTGSSAFSRIHLATQTNRKGWCGTISGLRRKKECEKKGTVWKLKPAYRNNPTLPPVFTTERKFFEFLELEWVEPKDRSWISNKNPELNYSP